MMVLERRAGLGGEGVGLRGRDRSDGLVVRPTWLFMTKNKI